LQNLVFQQGKSGFQANLSDSGINLGVCAIPFALAQRQVTKRAVAQSTLQKPDSAANLPEAAPPATGAIFAKALPNISQTGQSQLPTTSNVGAPAFAITRTPAQESK
jgi:hypothetical protein